MPRFTVERLFLQQTKEVDALGALDGHTHGAVPDELDQGSKGTANTESDGVVEWLLEAVVVEEDTGDGVDVGVGVLGLDETHCQLQVHGAVIGRFVEHTFPCSVRTPGAISEFFLTSWKTGLARTSGRVAAKSIRAWKRGSGLRRTP